MPVRESGGRTRAYESRHCDRYGTVFVTEATPCNPAVRRTVFSACPRTLIRTAQAKPLSKPLCRRDRSYAPTEREGPPAGGRIKQICPPILVHRPLGVRVMAG